MAGPASGQAQTAAQRRVWWRRNRRGLVAAAVLLVVLCVCCDVPAWLTLAWYAVATSCGHVTISDFNPHVAGATRAETCLTRAYQHCALASLGVDFTGVDTGESYVFVVEPYGFTCAIGAIGHGSGARGPLPIPIGDGFCTGGMQLGQDGLHVRGCPSGDVLVPLDS
jgi:hypothetical protein